MANYNNPFQTTKPVKSSEVINRKDEAVRLAALAREGNNTRLVAPRRYGKTSLLRKVQEDLVTEGGWSTVYVDLFGVLTADDFARKIDRAYSKALKGPMAQWFAARRRSLRPTATVGGGTPLSGTVDLSPRGAEALQDVLDLPLRLHEKYGKRVHVVFDEFQELLAVDGQVDSLVRSVIQHHGEAASYVFAGSQISMMEELFTNRKRAFYSQAQRIALSPLSDEDLGEYITKKFNRTKRSISPEVLTALLSFVVGHPQRSMMVAHELWERSSTNATDEIGWLEARGDAVSLVEDDLRKQWMDLTPAARRVLTAIASGSGPYSGVKREARGSAVTQPLKTLAGEGIIFKTGKKWDIVDPLFKYLIRDSRGK